MEKKKDFTIEELKKQCDEAKKNFETLNEQLKKAEQEEEARKKAELELEKENRKKELNEAREHYDTLLQAYLRDYGAYSAGNIDDDFFNSFWRGFF